MNNSEEIVIARMKKLLAMDGTSTQLLTEEQLAQAEVYLDFPLPPLLRKIYLEVGNGVFGLFPLDRNSSYLADEFGLVESYWERRSMTQEESDAEWEENDEKPAVWPEKLLLIYDWGCNIYSCLDCSTPEYPVLRNDNNRSLKTFAIEAPSFQQWLQILLDGTLNFEWDKAKKVALKMIGN